VAKESRVVVRRISVSGRHASGADPAAISALYERQFAAFVAGAYAVVGESEAARDVVQEAFARALRERRSFRADGSLEAWLWRIIVNVARDTARRSRFADLSADELGELASLRIDHLDGGELREELRALPERQRLAVFFHYYADLPYEEVAELLGIAPGTVAASLNAARKTLRHRIEEAYE
jgi:RNA polymerase sigma-70 factor (ECF subfamily)